MPDTKTEMKSKHIPVVCTKAMEQFLAVSPGRDLISLWLKPFRVFICTLAPEVYELIWMPIKGCNFPELVFFGGHRGFLPVSSFPNTYRYLLQGCSSFLVSEHRRVPRDKALWKVHSLIKVITSLRRVLQNFGFGTRHPFLTLKHRCRLLPMPDACPPALGKAAPE